FKRLIVASAAYLDYNVARKRRHERREEVKMERYFIIVPCYNEEEVLPETIKRLGDCLDKLVERGYASPDSRVLFVNDGSADRTWEIITDANAHDERFAGLCL